MRLPFDVEVYGNILILLNRRTINGKTAGERKVEEDLSPSKPDLILTNKNKNCQAKHAACANDEMQSVG